MAYSSIAAIQLNIYLDGPAGEEQRVEESHLSHRSWEDQLAECQLSFGNRKRQRSKKVGEKIKHDHEGQAVFSHLNSITMAARTM